MADFTVVKQVATQQGKNAAQNNGISFSGAATGASVGGAIGSVVPVVGTVVGGAIGGAVGFFSDNGDKIGDFFGSKGGNKNDGTQWIPFDKYFKGGSKFGQVPTLEDTNPNWANSYYNGIKSQWSTFAGRSLDEWNNVFIYVLTKNPAFFNNISGDWVTPLNNEFKRLTNQQTTMPTNTTSFTAATGSVGQSNVIDWGKIGRDILIGGATGGAASANEQLSKNEEYNKAKSNLIDSATGLGTSAISTILKKFWYVPLLVLVGFFALRRIFTYNKNGFGLRSSHPNSDWKNPYK